jgi:hypothetical protein
MLEAIENSAYAVWVRESPSIFAYTSILSLHAIGLAIIVGIHTLVALRLLGFVAAIPLQPLRKLFPWMYLGFAINLFSGSSLLAANLTADLGNWLFIAKLVFILLAMVNLELTRMYVFDKPAYALPAGALPAAAGELPKHARTFAITALVLWSLAMVAGRFTAYPNFVEAWLGF